MRQRGEVSLRETIRARDRDIELAVKHGRCLLPQSPQGRACGVS
ncbi:protein of unknown function [Shewanella benthica]|uniref:Uncharacterized protein n=1 Tax=Shewanella benthica TaxID=43661 RepID=A0A330M065_9GAMM|nr:protein of unknown function [Shewanella benthica]